MLHGRGLLFRGTIRSMPPLTLEELTILAMACRCLADQQRQHAAEIENPTIRFPLEQAAERSLALAERFERARKLKQER